MKQLSLVDMSKMDENENNNYNKNIEAPIYEPKNMKPHILELYDITKVKRLINDIKNSNLEEEEKEFLIEASKRHTIFNYEKIADYYAHATPEMQSLMESSALVIIDFEKAIDLGYANLCEEIKKQYFEEYKDNE